MRDREMDRNDRLFPGAALAVALVTGVLALGLSISEAQEENDSTITIAGMGGFVEYLFDEDTPAKDTVVSTNLHDVQVLEAVNPPQVNKLDLVIDIEITPPGSASGFGRLVTAGKFTKARWTLKLGCFDDKDMTLAKGRIKIKDASASDTKTIKVPDFDDDCTLVWVDFKFSGPEFEEGTKLKVSASLKLPS